MEARYVLLMCGVLGLLANPSPGATTEMVFGQEKPVAVSASDTAQLVATQGGKGWYDVGLVRRHDGVFDLREVYALRLEVLNEGEVPFVGKVELCLAEGQGREDRRESSSTSFRVGTATGWQAVDLPIPSFDFPRGELLSLKFIAKIRFGGVSGAAQIRNVRLVEAPAFKLSSPVRSRAADGGEASYTFEVKNCTDAAQEVRLSVDKLGWEGLSTALSSEFLAFGPGSVTNVTLRVGMPAKLPPGVFERTVVRATPVAAGLPSSTLEFITVQRVPSPFLLHDAAGWAEVKAKAEQYDWAKKQVDGILTSASGWQPATNVGVKTTVNTIGVSVHTEFYKLREAAMAYRLTGDKAYLGKVRQFLLRFSDPRDAYPVLLQATNQGMPQEGGVMDCVAVAYDLVRDDLSEAERAQIEDSLRIFVDTLLDRLGDGGISNWSIFNQVPGAGCALLLHDMVRFNQLMDDPTGLIDQFRYGIMDDGWWYEMSLSYNIHCAEGFTRLALMARHFGIDLVNRQFPSATTDLIGIRPYELSNYLGMSFTKAGPVKRNMIGFKAMWDAILGFPDYRGVMVGMGDGHEQVVSGNEYDFAYYVFRNPLYAAAIRDPSDRDLLFSVPDLPADPPKLYERTVYSDNAGIALLRSQRGDMRDRIQLGFKYGTHGGYHGHFDRLSLLCLMRYGRGFWNPESTWYGYGSYLYKWWVQPSLSHNMVIVDGKQQEPVDCTPLLVHAGTNLQVIAAESAPRWSHPPYLGGYEVIDKIQSGEDRYVPIPDDHPAVGEVSGYTEPVYARRLQLVTDDYVLIADYQKAEREHAFDNIIHLRGARPVAGATRSGHRAKYDDSPLSSGQFVVNCEEYDLAAPAKVASRHRFNEKGDNGQNKKGFNELTDVFYHEPGDLFIDAYALYPAKAQLLIADVPEVQAIAKRLAYEVKGDDKVLASGLFRAWILGAGFVDVDVTGVRTLTLVTSKDTDQNVGDTLFWANAVVEAKDGKTVRLADLKAERSGLKDSPAPGVDFVGGPVRIEGVPYADTVGAEPQSSREPGVVTVDLSGLDAVRFRAVVGGDFPAGQEENLRKTVAVRTVGPEALFLTLLEPREGDARVASASALDEETVEVKMVNGRVDRLVVKGLRGDGRPSVELYRDGSLVESTGAPD